MRRIRRQPDKASDAAGRDIPHALGRVEQEQFILLEWAAQSPPILVPINRGPWPAELVSEKAIRVEAVVLQEVVRFAMQSVGARLGLYQHHRSAGASELGGIRVREDLEFPDGTDVYILPVLILG